MLVAVPILISAVGPYQNFPDRIVAAHNRERSKVGAPLLTWSPELAERAQAWAKHLAKTGSFAHSNRFGDYSEGENLWAGTSGFYQPEAMVEHWIAEKRLFKHGVYPDNSVTGNAADVGHYTQVIWASTTVIGCALAKSQDEDFLVCRYRQPGNLIGSRPL